jgi:6-phosphogluconolactonase (cycloisomerase 2 family)
MGGMSLSSGWILSVQSCDLCVRICLLGFAFFVKTFFMNSRLLNCFIGAAACVTLFSCTKNPGGVSGAAEGKIVYVMSNDYHENANAVLAYRHMSDGSIVPLPGSPFLTHGAGVGNPDEVLGPDDTDDPLIVSADGQYLLAVNGGSNTIAVFAIGRDGSLSPVPGSPFASGGQTPCSIAINGRIVYVANKSFDPLHTITQLPNYVSFTIDGAGRLEQVPGSKVEVPAGSSPSQVLVSNDRRFLFATDFLGFMLGSKDVQPVGTLVSFDLSGLGALKWAPGAPYALPAADGGALGLAIHPSYPILYVGFPVAGAFGVYSIDASTGALSLQNTVSAGAAACWLRTDADGRHLYVLNSGENSVGVYSLASPGSPVFVSKLVLKEGGSPLASGDFTLGFSPDGGTLYVVGQDINASAGGDYNFLHVLKVGTDGGLTEPNDPLALPVAADVRPMGVATR